MTGEEAAAIAAAIAVLAREAAERRTVVQNAPARWTRASASELAADMCAAPSWTDAARFEAVANRV